MKREKSPCTPLKRKAKGKETKPGFFGNPLSPRGRARTHEAVSRYILAGRAARELQSILGSRDDNDFLLWAYYCYHFDFARLFDKAYECASRKRQGEINEPIKTFQKWLTANYGEVGQ